MSHAKRYITSGCSRATASSAELPALTTEAVLPPSPSISHSLSGYGPICARMIGQHINHRRWPVCTPHTRTCICTSCLDAFTHNAARRISKILCLGLHASTNRSKKTNSAFVGQALRMTSAELEHCRG